MRERARCLERFRLLSYYIFALVLWLYSSAATPATTTRQLLHLLEQVSSARGHVIHPVRHLPVPVEGGWGCVKVVSECACVLCARPPPPPFPSTHTLGAACSISMVRASLSTLASRSADLMSPTTHFSASSSLMCTWLARARRSIFWCTLQ